MNSRISRRLLMGWCLIICPLSYSSAQSDDFGLDFSVEAEKKIDKQWSVSLEGEFRRRDDAKTNDRWSLGLGVDYKIAKWVKASAGYSLLYDNTKRISYSDQEDVDDGDFDEVGMPKKCAQYWAPRHRFNVSLTFDKKLFGDFRFSLRERWQYTWRPEHTVSERWSYLDEAYDGKAKTYGGSGKNVLRSRLQVEYDRKGLSLTPYANVEFWNAWKLQKTRYTVGLDWKLSKQHAVGAFYYYQKVNDDDDLEPNRHLLGVSYKFKF
jgi:opacity protein-like surface antigen